MRRYGSFLVRWWELGPAGRRVTVRHVQTDEEVTAATLQEVLDWMAAHLAAIGRDPPAPAGAARGPGEDGRGAE